MLNKAQKFERAFERLAEHDIMSKLELEKKHGLLTKENSGVVRQLSTMLQSFFLWTRIVFSTGIKQEDKV